MAQLYQSKRGTMLGESLGISGHNHTAGAVSAGQTWWENRGSRDVSGRRGSSPGQLRGVGVRRLCYIGGGKQNKGPALFGVGPFSFNLQCFTVSSQRFHCARHSSSIVCATAWLDSIVLKEEYIRGKALAGREFRGTAESQQHLHQASLTDTLSCRRLNRPNYFFCAHDFTAAISASASLVVPLLVHSCNIHAVSFFTRN